jgi:hypothetical protein
MQEKTHKWNFLYREFLKPAFGPILVILGTGAIIALILGGILLLD